MRTYGVVLGLVGGALAFAACGGDDSFVFSNNPAGTGGSGGTTSSAGGGNAGGGSATGGSGGSGGAVSNSCGDGVVDPGESCDDGNGINGDACPDGLNGTCQMFACGDGHLYNNSNVEECDDGNTTPGDGCDANCMWENVCGDGQVDPGEECDLGTGNDDEASGDCAVTCRTNCLCPACGDGVADFAAGEECDDGNTKSNDGCSATCKAEAPSTCGDGTWDPPLEECDDGNTASGDGCDDACQLEPVGQTCPNNMTEANEKCDDDNSVNGDGCSPTCNFLGQVTEMAVNAPGNTLATDGTYLYLFGEGSNCQIHRVAIASCTSSGCAFTPYVGAAGGCPTGSGPVDGPGATAVIASQSEGLAFGGGKLYFSDQHTIREIDLSAGTLDVTTVAGDATRCGELDGNGTNAVMSDIRGLAWFAGKVWFVDGNMATLRTFDPATGDVTTVAGQSPNDNSGSGYDCSVNLCCGNNAAATDGYGTAAVLNSPRYITSDNAGNIFMVDTNGSAIRRYNTVTGYVSTMIAGQPYMDGAAGAAGIDRPRGIGSDGTSIYFGEQNTGTIRQTIISSGDTSTWVGVRGCTTPGNLMGGTGADGTQDWSGNCGMAAVTSLPQFPTGKVGMVYDFGSQAMWAVAQGGRLLKIE